MTTDDDDLPVSIDGHGWRRSRKRRRRSLQSRSHGRTGMRQGVRVMMLLLLLLLLSPLLLLLLVMMVLLLIEQMTAQITGSSDHLVRWSQRARNQSARSDNCQKEKKKK